MKVDDKKFAPYILAAAVVVPFVFYMNFPSSDASRRGESPGVSGGVSANLDSRIASIRNNDVRILVRDQYVVGSAVQCGVAHDRIVALALQIAATIDTKTGGDKAILEIGNDMLRLGGKRGGQAIDCETVRREFAKLEANFSR